MAATIRWGAALAALATLAGCGGSNEVGPESPKPGGQSDDGVVAVLEPPLDAPLTEVARPESVFAIGRWRDPATTADTLMDWSNLPFDWRRLLQAKEPELYRLVAWNAPVDLVVALDPAEDQAGPPLVAVISAGVNSLDDAVAFVREYGESVTQRQPGVYRIGDGGEASCALARSFGPTPARVVCGERERDLDLLLPYATRGLPKEDLGGSELHLELRVEPIRREYGRSMRQYIAMALPEELRPLSLGVPRFDRALADAVHGLADEALALVETADRVTLDLDALAQAGTVQVATGLKLQSAESWTAQTIVHDAERAGPAPGEFWRLPADSSLAGYSVNGDPKRLADIRRTVAELLDGWLSHEKAPPALRNRLVAIVHDSWIDDGWVVYSSGEVKPDAALKGDASARRREIARRAIGWHIWGLPNRPASVKRYLDEIVSVYRGPQFTKFVTSGSGIRRDELPKLSARAERGAGLPAGSRTYEFVVPASTFAVYSVDAGKRTGGTPLPVYLTVVPDGDRTWVGLSADAKHLRQKLVTVLRAPREQTLQGRGGLTSLRQGKHVEAGFTSLSGLAGSALLWAMADEDEPKTDLFAHAPHGGQTPWFFTANATAAPSPQYEIKATIPKEALQDLLAVAMSAGLSFN